MTITISRDKLLAACNKVSKVIASKNTLPILDSIKICVNRVGNVITFEASDLQTHISTMITHYDEGDYSSKYEFCLASKLLTDTLSKLPSEDIKIEISDVTCRIITSTGEFLMPVQSANDFPSKQAMTDVAFEVNNVPLEELFSTIHSVMFAIGKDELRPQICGLNMVKRNNMIYFCATDANRGSTNLIDVASEGDVNIIIPSKPISNLMNFFEDKVTIKYGKFLSVSDGNTHIQITLVQGSFPALFNVIPPIKEDDVVFTVDKQELLKTLRLAYLYANKSNGLISIEVSTGEIIVEASDVDYNISATEKLPCRTSGNVRIGFNGDKLLDCVKSLTCTQLEFRMTAPSKAALLLDADRMSEQRTIIMPLLIS